MEHYFSLYNITDDLAKLRYGVLHLDQERWQWWQWRKTSRQGYIAWTQFVAELYERFDTDTNHLVRLTKLKQSGTVEDFIAAFERLAFRTEGMTDAFFRECFISGLKEEVRAHVLMARPTTWVEATKKAKEAQQIVSSQNRKPSFIPRPKPVNPTTPSAPLKIQKLTRAEMVERQLKGLCYNCDEKYFPGHKCKEQNFFMAISKDISEEDVETPLVSKSPETTDITPPSDPPKVKPVISLNDLTGFSAPQILKLIGYIKHRKVIILVDSGSTHNFIHRRISQETHCYIHAFNNFQIMISNGGSMKCGGRCENVCLQIGDYHLKSHMFAIDMGGCDIVLGADWLRTLGPILMDFKELTIQFDQEGQKYKFQGIIVGSRKVINSPLMEKLLKKGHYGIISKLHAIQATKTPSVLQDLQSILSKHQVVFSTSHGIHPSHGVHDNSIPLVPRSC
ncbi:retropepsin-like aspartic protease family protein, partial [Corynebacterium pilbarense]